MMRPPSLPVPPNVCPYCTAGDADAVGINRNATSAAATKMALLLRKTPPPPGSDWFEGYLWIRAMVGQNLPDECSHGGCGRRPGSQIPERAFQSEGGEVGDQLVLRRPDVLELQAVAVEGQAQRVRLLGREGRALRSRIRVPPVVDVGRAAEEDHVVRTRVQDVVPPLRGGEGQVHARFPGRGRRAPVREGDRDRFRAMMALRSDPDLLVQHGV